MSREAREKNPGSDGVKKGDLSSGATKIFHVFDISHKFATDQENPEYFRISGNRAVSHYGGCPGCGGEAPRNVFN